ERLAGGTHGQVAALWQSLGDRPAGNLLRGEVWWSHRGGQGRTWAAPGPLAARNRGEGGGLRHTDPRLSRGHVQHTPSLEGRGRGVVRFRRLQPRRLLPGSCRQGEVGDHREGALPKRRPCPGQAPAPATTVFLRELLAAGHDSDSSRGE